MTSWDASNTAKMRTAINGNCENGSLDSIWNWPRTKPGCSPSGALLHPHKGTGARKGQRLLSSWLQARVWQSQERTLRRDPSPEPEEPQKVPCADPSVADRTLALATPGTTRASLDAAPRLLPILWPAPLRASPQCCPPRSPAPVETPATKRHPLGSPAVEPIGSGSTYR